MKTATLSRFGFTLIESLIAMSLSSALFGLLMVSAMGFQRSFVATGNQVTSHNEQLRLTDYLARDLRSASNVSVRNDGKGIDIVIPTADANTLSTNLNLPVVGQLLQANASGTNRTICYYLHGTDLYRVEDGQRVEIARHISSFTATPTGGRVVVEAAFKSQFSRNRTTAPSMKVTRAIWLRNTSH